MFDKDSRFYPAASAAFFVCAVIIAWFLMTKTAGASTEQAQCAQR